MKYALPRGPSFRDSLVIAKTNIGQDVERRNRNVYQLAKAKTGRLMLLLERTCTQRKARLGPSTARGSEGSGVRTAPGSSMPPATTPSRHAPAQASPTLPCFERQPAFVAGEPFASSSDHCSASTWRVAHEDVHSVQIIKH